MKSVHNEVRAKLNEELYQRVTIRAVLEYSGNTPALVIEALQKFMEGYGFSVQRAVNPRKKP